MSKYHEPMLLNPALLFSSVGTCGTNAPEDVKKIQRMMTQAGYQQNTGRSPGVDGQCGQLTIEAIRWYQRLLNMKPTGLVHPFDSAFIEALNSAAPGWRPKHQRGPLTVQEGQFTFNCEGVDFVTATVPFKLQRYPYFSRILHWPGWVSGVTLGRGFDMGNRSAGEIFATLSRSGIEEYKSSICSRAAGLKGQPAREFVRAYGPLIGEISHQQQVSLFEITFEKYINDAKRIFSNANGLSVTWYSIEKKIREVFCDTLYQGNVTAKEMAIVMAHRDKPLLIKYLMANRVGKDLRRDALRIRYIQ